MEKAWLVKLSKYLVIKDLEKTEINFEIRIDITDEEVIKKMKEQLTNTGYKFEQGEQPEERYKRVDTGYYSQNKERNIAVFDDYHKKILSRMRTEVGNHINLPEYMRQYHIQKPESGSTSAKDYQISLPRKDEKWNAKDASHPVFNFHLYKLEDFVLLL